MTTETTLTHGPVPPRAALYRKMSEVIGLLNEGLSKDGYNPHHRYKFMEAEEVKRAVGAAFKVVGLAMKVSFNRLERVELKPVNQKDADLLTVWYDISLLDGETGESETIQWPSMVTVYGHDDKVLNKAATSAVKYFLLSTFLIPDEDEHANDTDRAGEERQPIQRAPLTNGRGEPHDMPQPPSSRDGKPQPPKWLDGVKKRYQDKNGDSGLDAFMDKARALWADKKLTAETPEPTAFALIANAIEEDENAKLVGPDDGIPVSWAPVVRSVARHFDGDVEEAKAFIRGQLKANAITTKMTPDTAKTKLIGVMAKMSEAEAFDEPTPIAQAQGAVVITANPSDPFADLMTK